MSKTQLINNTVDDTIDKIEEILDIRINNRAKNEILNLLNNYFDENKTYDEQLHAANSWGGGVWDLLYHSFDEYKADLVLNYYQRQYRPLSPVYAQFPYDELNGYCVNTLEMINKIKND